MMAMFIRYCSRSMVDWMWMSSSMARVKRVQDSREFSLPLMVGGSCLWSPASSTRRPLRRGIQQLTSKACPHSSITTRSKRVLGRYRWNTRSAAPTFVQQSTGVSLISSSITCSCSRQISSFSCLISFHSTFFSSRFPPFDSFFLRLCSFFTSVFQALLFWAIWQSKHLSSTLSMILAGLPILRQGTRPTSPSTMLSTAMFDGPQASTLYPRLTASTIASQTVVVLPVPGGPCSRKICSRMPCYMASFCSGLSLGLWQAWCWDEWRGRAAVVWVYGKKTGRRADSDFYSASSTLKYRLKVTQFHLRTMLQLTPSKSLSSSSSFRVEICSLDPIRLLTTPSAMAKLLRKSATSSPTWILHSSGIKQGFFSEWQALVTESTVLPQQPRLVEVISMFASPYPSVSIQPIVLFFVIQLNSSISYSSSCLSSARVFTQKSFAELQVSCRAALATDYPSSPCCPSWSQLTTSAYYVSLAGNTYCPSLPLPLADYDYI